MASESESHPGPGVFSWGKSSCIVGPFARPRKQMSPAGPLGGVFVDRALRRGPAREESAGEWWLVCGPSSLPGQVSLESEEVISEHKSCREE